MQDEFRKVLSEALLSGKYIKTRYTLRANDPRDRPCCCIMGVVCDLLYPEGWEFNRGRGCWEHRDEYIGPNVEMLAAVGITTDEAEMLIYWNDEMGLTFVEMEQLLEPGDYAVQLERTVERRRLRERALAPAGG